MKVTTQNQSIDFLTGGGEMGELIRSYDWSKNPLGPPQGWSNSLRTIVRIMFTSQQPIWIGWGKELINLYNDPYRAIAGGKHPWALGQPVSIVWKDIWNDVGRMLKGVIETNEGTYVEAFLFIMERNGYPEETYYTFSYSPIPDDDGSIGGIFCTNTDSTRQIIGERQLSLLRDLASRTVNCTSLKDVYKKSGESLSSNLKDIPFAMIYLLDEEKHCVRLVGASGIDAGDEAAPEQLDLNDESIWPIKEVITANKEVIVTDLTKFDNLPFGGWDRRPHQAAITPIAQSGKTGKEAFLITGLNPLRLFDDDYKGFIKLVAGQIASSIATVQVLEEERKRAQALAEIDKAKTVFFSNVSHEFRTPLTLMLGPLENILNNNKLEHDTKKDLEIVHRNSLRLLKLVNTLLDFSRIEAGRTQAFFKKTEVCKVTYDLANAFRSAIEKAGFTFKIDCEKITDEVYIDTTMWERIVFNLLSNAYKFTFAGEISLQLKNAGGNIQLIVKDTGAGIPEKELPNLFSRFHRIENTKGRTHEGTGIGLAMVNELVKLHGGEIEVESKQGVGTSFIITIPKGKEHLPQSQVAAEGIANRITLNAQPNIEEELGMLSSSETDSDSIIGNPNLNSLVSSEREKILIADDNPDMREYITKLLERNYDIITAADGVEALKLAKEENPSLILSDIMMPNLDGLGLLKKLREYTATKTIPLIFLSARAGEEAKIEGIEAGADDYLVKPFSAKELLARVQTNLGMSKLRKQAEERVKTERERLYEVFMQAPAMIAILRGDDLTFELANPLYLKTIGKTAEEVIGKSIWEVLPELKGQPIEGILRNVYTTSERFAGNELPVKLDINNNGILEDVYFNFVYEAYRESLDKIAGILVHAVDVTAQVLDRKKIEEAEARSRLAIEAADMGAFDWDLTNQNFLSSSRLLEIFGFKDQPDTTHQDLINAFHPDDKGIRDKAVADSYAKGSMVYEARVIWKDKSIHWLRIYGRIVYNEQQAPVRMYGLVIDITEQKTTTEELEKSNIQLSKINNDLDNFIYTASHDLKAPVSNIEGLIYTLLDVIAENADAKEIIELMNKSVQRFKGTILDLTEISKTQKDTKGEEEEINIQEVLEDVTSSIENLITKSEAVIKSTISCKTIRFSKVNFRSILYNLISNGIKYCAPDRKPVIEITCTGQGEELLLTVKDNGLGISEQNRNKLFTMFKRFHDHVEGTGIGLYIVKKIIDNAGGSIEVESEVGKGTTFKVYFKK